MTTFGKYTLPPELCIGASFSGFKVESAKQTETGFVWVFSRSNHALVLALPYDEFFDLLSNPRLGEYLMDEMASELHKQFRDRDRIASTDTELGH